MLASLIGIENNLDHGEIQLYLGHCAAPICICYLAQAHFLHYSKNMIDALLCAVPKLKVGAPLVGPAILKACGQSHGFNVKCLDLNLKLWHQLKGSDYRVLEDGNLTFNRHELYEEFKKNVFDKILDEWVDLIVSHKPRYIGFTCFSESSRFVLTDLCRRLRPFNIPIVVGGPEMNIPLDLKKDGLIDYYIFGDAEEAFINLLKGDLQSEGINDAKILQLRNLEDYPCPDYRDAELRLYPADFYNPDINDLGAKLLYITGSRGCVRACSFCDVANIWKKFRYRSGKNIAREMITQYHRHGIRHFFFTDSLINGSMKILRELCKDLIEFKESSNVNLKWSGQFICLPIEKMPPEDYDLMKRAGCQFVVVGIESGSEKVRDHMKKMFSNEDVKNMVRECCRVNIRFSPLLLVGYPTETEEDFLETIKLMEELLPYKKVITKVSLGPTMLILPQTPIDAMKAELGVDFKSHSDWSLGDNTKKTRIERWFRLREKLLEFNYQINEKSVEHLKVEYEKLAEASI